MAEFQQALEKFGFQLSPEDRQGVLQKIRAFRGNDCLAKNTYIYIYIHIKINMYNVNLNMSSYMYVYIHICIDSGPLFEPPARRTDCSC